MRALLLMGLVLLVGCGKTKPTEEEWKPSVRTGGTSQVRSDTSSANIGQEIPCGDLAVTVTSVSAGSFATADSPVNQPILIIGIRVRATNPNRIIDVPAQFGSAKLTDDLGNSYKELRLDNERNYLEFRIGDSGGKPTTLYQSPIKEKVRLRPDTSAGDVIAFELPVPTASKVVMSLDATKYGAAGVIRLELPRATWEPKK